MSEGLRRLFRSCFIPAAVLILSGALVAGAQTFPGPVDPHSAGWPGMDGARGMYARLAAQIDTPKVVPGTRDFLEPNAPNPFGTASQTTRLAFTIAERSTVELRIYDFFYNPVVTLMNQELDPGRHVVQFRPPPTMPSGMYFFELKTNRFRDLRRMMYIK